MADEDKANGPSGAESTSVVTGAFSFTGQHIARKLLSERENVRTLTNHPRPELPLFRRVQLLPLNFQNAAELTDSMRGASVLYNTYWVRFPYGELTHERAVRNTETLVRAAEAAGVKRIVHVSIANCALDMPWSYYRGKAKVEQVIQNSSLSYAILRPAVLFGTGDILINNIAFLLRHSPVFAIPGDGKYRVQPTYVGDLAELMVESGRRTDNFVMDAAGPEIYTYKDLVKLIRTAVGSRSWIVSMRPELLNTASRTLGTMLGDVLLTNDEIEGLMAELLLSHEPPACRTSLAAWLQSQAENLGRNYASELARHYR